MLTVHVVILAAGKGTRMRSSLPKVMHPIGGLPLLGHVLKTVQEISSVHDKVQVHTVLAPSMTDVADFVREMIPMARLAIQDNQLGTAHAVSCALEGAEINPEDRILVLFGDTPLIQAKTLQILLTSLEQKDIVVAGMNLEDPKSYGRLVVDAEGNLEKIVEAKHATSQELALTFCNSGVMGFKGACLKSVLPRIQPQELNDEYYLTDAIELVQQDKGVVTTIIVDADEVEGINTRKDLAQAEERFQNRCRLAFMEQGVTLLDPQSVYFSHDTRIEEDVTVEPHVFFGPNVYIKSQAYIKAFSHIEGAVIEAKASIGPFARLRPGTTVGEKARIGNFVEVKNATFEAGAKANHLSYVGDAFVGRDANIGAGTITCNYDGYLKHKTHISEGAFIGSNTCLVAPVSIGKNAIIGAASTITKNVDEDALAVARAPQKSYEGKARALREKKLAEKNTRVA